MMKFVIGVLLISCAVNASHTVQDKTEGSCHSCQKKMQDIFNFLNSSFGYDLATDGVDNLCHRLDTNEVQTFCMRSLRGIYSAALELFGTPNSRLAICTALKQCENNTIELPFKLNKGTVCNVCRTSMKVLYDSNIPELIVELSAKVCSLFNEGFPRLICAISEWGIDEFVRHVLKNPHLCEDIFLCPRTPDAWMSQYGL